MNEHHNKRGRKLIFFFSLFVLIVSLASVWAIVGFEGYVRWALNKDFMLLGVGELPALIVSTFALLLGMLYLYRPERGGRKNDHD